MKNYGCRDKSAQQVFWHFFNILYKNERKNTIYQKFSLLKHIIQDSNRQYYTFCHMNMFHWKQLTYRAGLSKKPISVYSKVKRRKLRERLLHINQWSSKNLYFGNKSKLKNHCAQNPERIAIKEMESKVLFSFGYLFLSTLPKAFTFSLPYFPIIHLKKVNIDVLTTCSILNFPTGHYHLSINPFSLLKILYGSVCPYIKHIKVFSLISNTISLWW